MVFSLFRKKDPEADIPSPVGDFVDIMHNPSQNRKVDVMLQRVKDVSTGTAALVLQQSDMVGGKSGMVKKVRSQDIDGPAANVEPGFNEAQNVLTNDSFLEIRIVNDQSGLKSLLQGREIFTVKSLREIYDTIPQGRKTKFMTILQFRKYGSEGDWYKPNDRGIFEGTNGLTLNLGDLLKSPHMGSLKNKTA